MPRYAIVNMQISSQIAGKESFMVEDVIEVGMDKLMVDGVPSDEKGAIWVRNFLKLPDYKFAERTSYNGSFKKNYAGIGMYFCPQRDAFITNKPTENPADKEGNSIAGEWVFNEETCNWNFNNFNL